MNEQTTRMPSHIREVFTPLNDDIAWLHAKWQNYLELFGVDEKRVNLLNRVAPTFFGICQRVLTDDLILSLCRLADPAKTRIHSQERCNLTFELLLERVDKNQYAELHCRLRACVDEFRKDCEPLKGWRNRCIAHSDLSTITATADPISGITRTMIRTALETTAKVMNVLSRHFEAREIQYHFDDPLFQGGECLVHYLERLT